MSKKRLYNEVDEEIIYTIGEEYVRSSKHTIKLANTNKINTLSDFIDEYRRVASLIIDILWTTGYSWIDDNGNHKIFNIKQKKYDLPKYFNYKFFNVQTDLSARALNSLTNQLGGLVKGLVKSKTVNKHTKLLTKPKTDKINPELSSKCMDIQFQRNGEFDAFIKLHSIGKKYGSIKIPIKYYDYMIESFQMEGFTLMKSICLKKDSIDLRWEMNPKTKRNKKEIIKHNVVGIDPGINKIVSLSDGQVLSLTDSQDKSFKQILNKLNNKQKDSKAYYRTLTERDNFIREIMNTIDFTDIKEIRFEHNKGLKKNTGNANHHWNYSLIIDQIKKLCENNQVDLVFTKSPYKSQRCFTCGFVHRRNRKKEKFNCISCNHTDDADINAAKNNSILLQKLPPTGLDNKKSGFLWKPLH